MRLHILPRATQVVLPKRITVCKGVLVDAGDFGNHSPLLNCVSVMDVKPIVVDRELQDLMVRSNSEVMIPFRDNLFAITAIIASL